MMPQDPWFYANEVRNGADVLAWHANSWISSGAGLGGCLMRQVGGHFYYSICTSATMETL
ncbi:MAG: hypothetical protein LZF86_190020 [Nitrospira sp.]|nr:MAG: hypothetical protein LZF86_190020 [Nitrospira sp.]